MAIRYRKGRASPWQCYWNNPLTGKRECANFASQHEAEKHDSLIKHRIRFDRESFRKEEEEQGKIEVLTLEACYLMYLNEKKFTKKALASQLSSMRYILEKISMLPVGDITFEDIEQIKNKMMEMQIKPVTVRNRLSILRTVLRWCAFKGFRGPVNFPRLPPRIYKKFIPPSQAELYAVLNTASPHIVRVVILGAQLGIRVGPSELLQLTWKDVDLERKMLRVHGAKKNINALWREVPIRNSLLELFHQWQKEDSRAGIAYLISYRGKPISQFKTAWAGALRRAGITRRMRPYDLRHAFGTEMIAAGVDIGTIAKLMGHSNPNMLLTHYQYVMDKQKRAAVEALPDISHVPITCAQK